MHSLGTVYKRDTALFKCRHLLLRTLWTTLNQWHALQLHQLWNTYLIVSYWDEAVGQQRCDGKIFTFVYYQSSEAFCWADDAQGLTKANSALEHFPTWMLDWKYFLPLVILTHCADCVNLDFTNAAILSVTLLSNRCSDELNNLIVLL